MYQEATDFLEESRALAAILKDADDSVFDKVTLFKDWTINDVIGHLHLWNKAAYLTLVEPDAFQSYIQKAMGHLMGGGTHVTLNSEMLDVTGRALYNEWVQYFEDLAAEYGKRDAQTRVKWAGPDMSAANKIVARQMETWAHGQEVYDVLGLKRENADRIKNICFIGIQTYGFCHKIRNIEPPKPKPFIKLTAPSGDIWIWNDPQDDNAIIGDADQFAQVVTQTRNIADVSLDVIGDIANNWMQIAQCFAGAPEDPPKAGSRHIAV